MENFGYLIRVNPSAMFNTKKTLNTVKPHYGQELRRLFGIYVGVNQERTFAMSQAQYSLFIYLRDKAGHGSIIKILDATRFSCFKPLPEHAIDLRERTACDIHSQNHHAMKEQPSEVTVKVDIKATAAKIERTDELLQRLYQLDEFHVAGVDLPANELLPIVLKKRQDLVKQMSADIKESYKGIIKERTTHEGY